MAIALVQQWEFGGTSVTPGAGVTITGPTTTAGNLLTLPILVRSVTATITSVTGGGNTWSVVPVSGGQGSARAYIAYCANAAPTGSVNVDINETGITVIVDLSEHSGAALSDVLEASAAADTATSLTPAARTVTTTTAGCLVVGAIVLGVTSRTLALNGTDYTAGTDAKVSGGHLLAASRVLAGTDTTGPSWTITSGSAQATGATTAAFKPFVAGPTPGSVTADADSSHPVDSADFTVNAVGTPGGGTYAWTQAGTAVTLADEDTVPVIVTPPTDDAGAAPAPTTLTVTYTPTGGGAPDSEDVVLTWTLPAPPTGSTVRADIVEYDTTAWDAPATIVHATGPEPTITEPTTGVFRVELPDGFAAGDTPITLTQTSTDTYGQATVVTLTITPGGAEPVLSERAVKVSGVYV